MNAIQSTLFADDTALPVDTLPTETLVTDIATARDLDTVFGLKLAEDLDATTGSGKFNLKGAAREGNIYRVNPLLLHFEDGLNSRDYNTARNRLHIVKLARSIAQEGVVEPIAVVNVNGKYIVTNGHCRLLAVFHAIKELGAEIKTVPIMTEKRHADKGEYVFTQITRNSGQTFSMLEMADAFTKLVKFGWKFPDIARRSGHSEAWVRKIVDFRANLTPTVRDMIDENRVSPTLVMETVAATGDGEVAEGLLREAQQVATERGKERVTGKHVRAAADARSEAAKVRTPREANATSKAIRAAQAAETEAAVRSTDDTAIVESSVPASPASQLPEIILPSDDWAVGPAAAGPGSEIVAILRSASISRGVDAGIITLSLDALDSLLTLLENAA